MSKEIFLDDIFHYKVFIAVVNGVYFVSYSDIPFVFAGLEVARVWLRMALTRQEMA